MCLGRLLLFTGQYLKSNSLTHHLIPLYTLIILFFVWLGRLLLSAGRYSESFEVLTHGVRVYPSAALYLTLAMAGYRMDRLDDAEDAVMEAVLMVRYPLNTLSNTPYPFPLPLFPSDHPTPSHHSSLLRRTTVIPTDG